MRHLFDNQPYNQLWFFIKIKIKITLFRLKKLTLHFWKVPTPLKLVFEPLKRSTVKHMYIYSCFLFLFSYLMWPLPLNASWAQLGYVLEEFEDATQCTKPYSNFYQIILFIIYNQSWIVNLPTFFNFVSLWYNF